MADAVAVTQPPRATTWVVLRASVLAVALTGIAGAALIFLRSDLRSTPLPAASWLWLLIGSCATLASLALRALRWVFLLRRTQVRIPIRDAYIGYFAGLSLLFVPFLIGEIAVRSLVLRSRCGVPVAATCVVNMWERLLDLVALAVIVLASTLLLGEADRWVVGPLAIVFAASFSLRVRRFAVSFAVGAANWMSTLVGVRWARLDPASIRDVASHRTWLVALATSVAAWLLPATALWGLAGAWAHPLSFAQAEDAYATSTLLGVTPMMPGGVLIVGGSLLAFLRAHAFAGQEAVLTTFALRSVTAGLAAVLGAVFVAVHFRARRVSSASHFDTIAHVYDVQIPEARRLALLTKKTELMQRWLVSHHAGRQGLDVGCGQGRYVARMRELGFQVSGIDDSARQIETARRYVDDPATVSLGSVLRIPWADASFDFVYVINVLHHLASPDEQRAAFAELERVLRPGGALFVHEINTSNLLFRFYMGYVFPSLNCIDEGIERWLLPDRLVAYTPTPVAHMEYFTFLPEFLPAWVLRLCAPFERRLERSPLRVFSAHYMAVLQKTSS